MQESNKLLMELLPRWNRFIGRGFKSVLPDGMTPLMHYLLMQLCGGPQSMSLLARGMQITKQQMTVMADKMIAMDIVRRVNDPNDRRVVLLEATEKGRELLMESHRKTGEHFSRMFEEMGAENELRFARAMAELNDVFSEIERKEKTNYTKGKENE